VKSRIFFEQLKNIHRDAITLNDALLESKEDQISFCDLDAFYKDIRRKDGNVLVYYYGSRAPTLERIKSVVSKVIKLRLGKLGLVKFLNIGRPFAKTPYSLFLLFSIYLLLRYSLSVLVFTRDVDYAIYDSIKKYIKNNNFQVLIFFTENSRLVEYARFAAIELNIPHIVFLHGITSSYFGRYYDLIYSGRTDIVRFVNMHAEMPQPKICEYLGLTTKRDEVVVFNNDVDFEAARDFEGTPLKSLTWVVIGSDIAIGDYAASALFALDLSLIEFSASHNIKCVYCPHPRLNGKLNGLLPIGTDIGRFSDFLGTNSCFFGHQSTALVNVKLYGYPVFISSTGYEMLGEELKAFWDISEIFDVSDLQISFLKRPYNQQLYNKSACIL